MIEAVFYLLAIDATEIITALFSVTWGIAGYIILMLVIVMRAALAHDYFQKRFLLPLALAPIWRLLELVMSLGDLSPIWLYFIVYASLFLTGIIVMRVLEYRAEDIGLSFNSIWGQLGIGLTGILLGSFGYIILRSGSLLPSSNWQIFLSLFILLLYAGFIEEFIFRGLMQHGAVDEFGNWGIILISLLTAVSYVRYLSIEWLFFSLAFSLYFGWLTRKTGSILGASLAHGLLNVTLFLVFPLLF